MYNKREKGKTAFKFDFPYLIEKISKFLKIIKWYSGLPPIVWNRKGFLIIHQVVILLKKFIKYFKIFLLSLY